jgi:hypothetical protein
VRARDFDEDGIPAERIVQHILRLGRARHAALGPGAYVIFERRIWSHKYGWRERPYSGANAHAAHFHVSVGTSAVSYDARNGWGIASLAEKSAAANPATQPTTPVTAVRPSDSSSDTENAPSGVEDEMKFFVVSDPSRGGDFGTNGVVKFQFASQEAKNAWADDWGATRKALSQASFDALPSVCVCNCGAA